MTLPALAEAILTLLSDWKNDLMHGKITIVNHKDGSSKTNYFNNGVIVKN